MRMGDFSADGSNAGGWVRCGSEGGKDDGGGPPTGSATESERSQKELQAKRARLVRTIEGEIVPRLVLARRVTRGADPVRAGEARVPDGCDVRELVRLLMAHDVSVASAYVEMVRQRGSTLETVCLDLLAPAARQFGLLWEEDECDFMQVTVGLCRLHQLLRELSPEFGYAGAERKVNRRILLAACPGDQHTFGISLVAQFLRRADWEVWHEFPGTCAEIVDLVRAHWFSVVGISVGTEARLDQLAETIGAVRRESRNARVGILVGGPIFVGKPELVQMVGADATAADGPQAVLRAEHICSAVREAS
jgi:methanogenic corrinoid protein MtbC1